LHDRDKIASRPIISLLLNRYATADLFDAVPKNFETENVSYGEECQKCAPVNILFDTALAINVAF
jgi:hypothetical protein